MVGTKMQMVFANKQPKIVPEQLIPPESAPNASQPFPTIQLLISATAPQAQHGTKKVTAVMTAPQVVKLVPRPRSALFASKPTSSISLKAHANATRLRLTTMVTVVKLYPNALMVPTTQVTRLVRIAILVVPSARP
jgi:hypothetical protein